MKDYIPLDRTFLQYDPALQEEHSDWVSKQSLRRSGLNWEQVLKAKCSIILGAAGSGKTYELKNKARTLRASGKNAFFCRLEILSDCPIELAIELPDREAFNHWKSSEETGYFFLDSVDEARLRSHVQFEKALINFSEGVKDHLERIVAVLSTRPQAWLALPDEDLLRRRLGLRDSEKAEIDQDGNPIVATGHEILFQKLTMAPLTDAQIRRYCEGMRVENVEKFVAAISDDNIVALSRRPADLLALISKWKRDGLLGNYSTAIDSITQERILEHNPHHSSESSIDRTRAIDGAQRLAAAVCLTRIDAIQIPAHETLESEERKSFPAADVLPSWNNPDLQELLGRAVFEEALFGTVRIWHKTISEYLCARWFQYLLDQRKNRRSIEALFIRNSHRFGSTLVPSTLKPVAAWLALWDDQFRQKIIAADPRVLLQFGDSSSLDVDVRISLLRQLADRFSGRSYSVISLDRPEIRRLAHPALANLISQLMSERFEDRDLRVLLIQLITEGRIKACLEAIKNNVYCERTDVHTRCLSIEALAATAERQDVDHFLNYILTNAATLDRNIIGSTVANFWPGALSDQQLLILVSIVAPPEIDHLDTLEFNFGSLADKLEDATRIAFLLSGIVSLIQTPPFYDQHSVISQRYAWLIRGMWAFAKKLSQLHSTPYMSTDFLSAITIAESCDRIDTYTADTHSEAVALIASDSHVRHAMIWHQCLDKRRKTTERVVDLWDAVSSMPLFHLSVDDLGPMLAAINEREHPDDKLVAVSALHHIYVRSGRRSSIRQKIYRTLSVDSVLHNAFKERIARKSRSNETRKAYRALQRQESKLQARQARFAADRQAAINRIRDSPEMLDDMSGTESGSVNQAIAFLFRQTRDRNDSGTTWTQSKWERLIPVCGKDVALRYREYCRRYWRLYEPALRSSSDFDDSGSPWGLLIGLSGIAMEARVNEKWPSDLSYEEARRATAYATLELNGFPDWLSALALAHPAAVSKVLLNEIKWELEQRKNITTHTLFHVLQKAPAIKLVPAREILTFLESSLDAPSSALGDALSYVLSDSSIDRNDIAKLAQSAFQSARDTDQSALWLSVFASLDPNRGVSALKKWIEDGSTPTVREDRLTAFLLHIWGDRSSSVRGLSDLWKEANHLLEIIKLSYEIVRPSDDKHRRGVYRPTSRDDVQRVRNSLVNLLAQIPGIATVDALIEISEWTREDYLRDNALSMAENRALDNIEMTNWDAHDVAKFAYDLEMEPRTEANLFDVACSRIDDLKLSLEQSDDSVASLWQKAQDEMELRRAIATELRREARGRYTIGAEEELADRTRTDLRFHHPSVANPVAIEIKVAGRYTGEELAAMIENQLINRYMKMSKYGVYLVIHRRGPKDRKSWPIGATQRHDFDALIGWLASRAEAICTRMPKISGIQVVGIDLTTRTMSSRPRKPSRTSRPGIVRQAQTRSRSK